MERDVRFFISDAYEKSSDLYLPENLHDLPRMGEKVWLDGFGTLEVIEVLHQGPNKVMNRWVTLVTLKQSR